MTIENIICGLLFGGMIFGLGSGIMYFVWKLFTSPYCNYKLYNKNNRIQWKCEETNSSKEKRLNNQSDLYECRVVFRILPSELNKFVRIFGDNDWENPFYDYKTFKNENEFKEFVSQWKTYGDIKKYLNNRDGILWYEP